MEQRSMNHSELSERWKEELKKHLAGRDELTARDFLLSVCILFEDGSYIRFENAFTICIGSAVGVFTEHCGYHFFDSNSIEQMIEQ